MRILYLVNVPAPYMVCYFNELGRHCELTVIFEKSTSTERDASWQNYHFTNFTGIILKGISTAPDAAFCPSVLRYLKKGYYDYIISSSMSTPTGILAIEYMKLTGIPFYLESEGGFAKDGKGLKERLKKQIMSDAAGYLSTTPIGDAYFLMYGASKEKIYKYPFTSLYRSDILSAPVSAEEKASLRRELGISGTRCVLAVGQFIHRKGFDILLEAARHLPEDTCVCFVGGEPTEEYTSFVDSCGLSRVSFIGFKSKEELKKYYMAADLFVHPTREDIWGLVINEAMAYGLPVVTTDRCIAGLELVDDTNGAVVPVEDPGALEKAINLILDQNSDRYTMGLRSLKKIEWYTFENMAAVHMDYFRSDFSV